MIDGSHHPFEKNVELTRQVVEYAHAHDVTVEASSACSRDRGRRGAAKAIYTQPEDVENFVQSTGVDSLAISIGTSSAPTFQARAVQAERQGVLEPPPPLRLTSWREIERRIPGFPIVLTDPRASCPSTWT
jgi:fructose-bisphosphate aldolase class II